jgi:hypothetical protein
MTQPGVAGEWSVKDILAHIAWYEDEEADFYGEINVEGSPFPGHLSRVAALAKDRGSLV